MSNHQQQSANYYPVSESFRVLDGYDLYRSNKLIIALVVVEGQFGRDLRLYRWQKRGEAWKVDLCRMSVARWPWDSLASKAKELVGKYEIAKNKKNTAFREDDKGSEKLEETVQ